MRISQFIVLITLLGFFCKSHFATIDDLFVPEDGENTCVFEGFSDDLDDEKSLFVDTVLGAREKSTFLEQKNQRTIEGCLYVETPPPENSCI